MLSPLGHPDKCWPQRTYPEGLNAHKRVVTGATEIEHGTWKMASNTRNQNCNNDGSAFIKIHFFQSQEEKYQLARFTLCASTNLMRLPRFVRVVGMSLFVSGLQGAFMG